MSEAKEEVAAAVEGTGGTETAAAAPAAEDLYRAVEGAPLLLLCDNGSGVTFARAGAAERPQRLSKRVPAVSLAPLLDSVYGSAYVLAEDDERRRCLVPTLPRGAADESDDAASVATSSAGDNRHLVDEGTHQALTADEIAALKKGGATADDVVRQLVANSATFQEKTVYAQEKYIRRKKQKHQTSVVSLFPCAANVARAAFAKDPARVAHVRPDTLARMLQKACLAEGARAAVCETCGGLLVAAVAERLGPHGTVHHVQCAARASTQRPHHAEHFRRPLADIQPLSLAPLLRAAMCDDDDDAAASAAAAEVLPKCSALLVATKFDPVAVTMALLPRVAGSGAVVVFCSFLRPLEQLAEIITGTLACDVDITETWTREYQVLPQRTHPTMDMHGASGYILTATKVIQTDTRLLRLARTALRRYVKPAPLVTPRAEAPEKQQQEEQDGAPAEKKRRVEEEKAQE